MRTLLWRVAAGAAILAVALWAINYVRITFPNREHAMTELTQTMRPFCIGRFLIDVPAQAKSNGLSQSIMGMGQIKVEKNITRGGYHLRTGEKEAELRAKPHKKEGSVLREVWHPEGVDGTLFFFRSNGIHTRNYDVLGYFWHDKQMYTFHYGSPNDAIQKSKNDLMRAFSLIQPRANDDVPQAAGACIDHAFVNGSGYREESIGGGFDFPGYPSLKLVLSTDVTNRPDKEGLLARVARHTPAMMMRFPDASIRTLRSAQRAVSGLAGEEIVERLGTHENDPLSKGNTYDATWEFNGPPKSMEQPAISISLSYDDGDGGKKLTEEEFLALWDAVVASLRPRPGAF